MGVSAVICTYNGRNTILKALEALAAQDCDCPFEVILIDNASADGTRELADEWWGKNGPDTIGYHSYQEPKPGKTYAQELGYSKANFEYLMVVDDDNLMARDYVRIAYEIMQSRPEIGALGGWCNAILTEEQPDWFEPYKWCFAVGKQGEVSGDITWKKGCLFGAGMLVRHSQWEYLNKIGYDPLMSCRKGNSLSSGGDTEYCYALRLLGYRIWYDERLYFDHYMIPGRVRLSYVSRLRKALSESNFTLRIYLDQLNGRNPTRTEFFGEFARRIRKSFFRMTAWRLSNDFEKKEQAKEYFRLLSNLVTGYTAYRKNRNALRSWLNNQSVSVPGT